MAEHSAAILDANRNADQLNRAVDRDRFIHCDTLEVDMKEPVVLDDMPLHVADDCNGSFLFAENTEVDQMGQFFPRTIAANSRLSTSILTGSFFSP